MGDEEQSEFTPENAVKVDVVALRSEAYEDGRRAGVKEGRDVGFRDGYSEGVGDLLERLKVLEIFDHEEHAGCLAEVERVAGGMRVP